VHVLLADHAVGAGGERPHGLDASPPGGDAESERAQVVRVGLLEHDEAIEVGRVVEQRPEDGHGRARDAGRVHGVVALEVCEAGAARERRDEQRHGGRVVAVVVGHGGEVHGQLEVEVHVQAGLGVDGEHVPGLGG
jgi:hypothetical protein